MKALILAAGKSTRIAPIAQGLPKPLLSFQGKTVLERTILWLAQAGIRDLWINLHYRSELIQEHLGDGKRLGVQIQYSLEPEILGTAGAVKKLESVWDSPFLVIYGDNLFSFCLEDFLSFHHREQTPLSIALFHPKTHLHTGIAGGKVLMQEAAVKGFIEGGPSHPFHYVNAGAYLLNPEILQQIPHHTFYDFGNDLFPKCINNDIKISGHIINGYCLGIDNPESYDKACRLLNEKDFDHRGCGIYWL